jgi:hypothetical protein
VLQLLELLEQQDHKDQQVRPDQKVTPVQPDRKDLQVLILGLPDPPDQKVTPVQLVRKVLREMQDRFPQFSL